MRRPTQKDTVALFISLQASRLSGVLALRILVPCGCFARGGLIVWDVLLVSLRDRQFGALCSFLRCGCRKLGHGGSARVQFYHVETSVCDVSHGDGEAKEGSREEENEEKQPDELHARQRREIIAPKVEDANRCRRAFSRKTSKEAHRRRTKNGSRRGQQGGSQL